MGDPSLESARDLLADEVETIGQKVEAGEPISDTDRAKLEVVAGEVGAWAESQVQLAGILGVDRKTIQRWRKIPGNPGVRSDGALNVADWREWAEQKQGHTFDTPDKAALEAQILLRKRKLLDIEIKRQLNEITDNYKLEVWIAEMVGAAKTVLLSLPGVLAPQVIGLTEAEAEQRIKEAIDGALRQLERQPWKEAPRDGDEAAQ